jgi:hypothetical protein
MYVIATSGWKQSCTPDMLLKKSSEILYIGVAEQRK